MAREIKPKDLEFRFRGNRLCLDFIATVGERGTRNVERLGTPARLLDWCLLTGLVTHPFQLSEDDLMEAQALREAMARLLVAVSEGTSFPGGDVTLVNACARRPVARPQIEARSGRLTLNSPAPVPAVLSEISRDFIRLITGDDVARVKTCEDTECRMFFLDLSPTNNRVWCSNEGKGCGNRAKKRAFRSRRQAQQQT